MDISGLNSITTSSEMLTWLAQHCLTPIDPVMTGSDLGTILQKIISLSGVTSVNGQTGTISLTSDDIGEGSTNKYFTEARVATYGDTRYALKSDKVNTINVSTVTATQYPTALAVINWAIGDANQFVYVQNARISVTQEIRTLGLLWGNTILASGAGSAINVADRGLNGLQYGMYGDNGFHFGVTLNTTYNDFWSANYATQVVTFPKSPIVPTATTSGQAVNLGQLDLKLNLTGGTLTGGLTGTSANFSSDVGGRTFTTNGNTGTLAAGDHSAALYRTGSAIADRRSGMAHYVAGVEDWFIGTNAAHTAYNITVDGTSAISIDRSTKAVNLIGHLAQATGLTMPANSNAEFYNLSSTGFGLYTQGGTNSNYALSVNKYDGTNAMKVLGNGNTTIAGTLTTGGMITASVGVASHAVKMMGAAPYISWYDVPGTARLAYIQHTGTGLFIVSDVGDLNTSNSIEITDTTKGLILKAPNGSRWRITIDNTGTLTRTSI
jgi:hypothetical protein